MTDADLKRIENELGIKLPANYTRLIRKFPDELRNWPPGQTRDVSQRFFPDAGHLLDVNRHFRASPRQFVSAPKELAKAWPLNYVVIGRMDDDWQVIDVSQKEPRIFTIEKGKLETYSSDFKATFDLWKYVHKELWKAERKKAKTTTPEESKATSKSKAMSKPTATDKAKASLAARKPVKSAAKLPASRTTKSAAVLSPQALLAEGRKLARPAVALYDRGKKYAAVWRGAGVVSPGPGEWRHWISIDTSFLPDNPRKLTGVVSLYDWWADDDRMGELKVVQDFQTALPRKTEGTKLYAKEFKCLPDVDALFHFGCKEVKAWRKVNKLDSDASYRVTPVKEYLDVLHREHPFVSQDGAYAMLGGWSWCFTWCYGTDEEYPWRLFKKPLIVLTIEDSEPWIEVYDDGKKFETFSRIT